MGKEDKKKKENKDVYEGISNKQALVYVVIIVVCFGLLYPRLIHPMCKMFFGFGEKPKADPKADIPPQMRAGGGHPMPGHRPGMRPPPGGRSEGQHQSETTSKGGGSGMMTMILPVYAVGIVGYLVYTATKVYGGKGKNKRKKTDTHEEVYTLITEKLATIDLEKVLTGADSKGAEEINKLAAYLKKKNRDSDSEDSDDSFSKYSKKSAETANEALNKTSKPKPSHKKKTKKPRVEEEEEEDLDEVEDLMMKCENQEAMTPEEMLKLQKKLQEFEGRMSKLMSAMKSVKKNTDSPSQNVKSQDDGAIEEEKEKKSSSDGYEDDSDAPSYPSIDESEVEMIYADMESSDEEIAESTENIEHGTNNLRKRTVITASDDL